MMQVQVLGSLSNHVDGNENVTLKEIIFLELILKGIFKLFQNSFTETLAMFFNRLKSDLILVRSPHNFQQ